MAQIKYLPNTIYGLYLNLYCCFVHQFVTKERLLEQKKKEIYGRNKNFSHKFYCINCKTAGIAQQSMQRKCARAVSNT